MTEAKMKPVDRLPAVAWGAGGVVKGTAVALGLIVALAVGLKLGSQWAGVPLRASPLTTTLFVLVQDLVLVAALWAFGVRRGGWRSLGLRRFEAPLGCSLAAGVLPASYAFNIAYAIVVIVILRLPYKPQAVLPLFGGGLAGFVAALITGVVIAPLAEEAFFRGFVFAGLRPRLGVVGAALISAAVFGAVHLSLGTFLPVAFLGLLLAMLYATTGSLYPGIIAHAFNNGFGLLLAYLLEVSRLAAG
jgi:membrane protease YdiL (CAAX protease family)